MGPVSGSHYVSLVFVWWCYDDGSSALKRRLLWELFSSNEGMISIDISIIEAITLVKFKYMSK
jgi:hypothetical protein